MKIMVTGHSGMLGREVLRASARMGHRTFADEDINIAKPTNLKNDLDVVINCAGLVPQRTPKPSPDEMLEINGRGPKRLAEVCDEIGAKLVHVSTDCVFDGSGPGPHDGDSIPRPISVYGQSKLAGEVTREPHLTVRTSFVGIGERGLVAELQRSNTYQASTKLLWTGHVARFVAEALVMLAERNLYGLIHVPAEERSRFDLVSDLQRTLDLDLEIVKADQPNIDRRLVSYRWQALPDLPSWEWQLEWLRRSQ